MSSLTEAQILEIRSIVLDYFSEECDVDKQTLTDSTNIVSELQGDSLMLLSLLETIRKKYGLTIELKTLGRHLMKRPANTIGNVVSLTRMLVEHGDNIVNMDA
jgi:acyl carrier protein